MQKLILITALLFSILSCSKQHSNTTTTQGVGDTLSSPTPVTMNMTIAGKLVSNSNNDSFNTQHYIYTYDDNKILINNLNASTKPLTNIDYIFNGTLKVKTEEARALGENAVYTMDKAVSKNRIEGYNTITVLGASKYQTKLNVGNVIFTSPTTLTDQTSVHYISGNITIQNGVSLMDNPTVVNKSNEGYIKINGKLVLYDEQLVSVNGVAQIYSLTPNKFGIHDNNNNISTINNTNLSIFGNLNFSSPTTSTFNIITPGGIYYGSVGCAYSTMMYPISQCAAPVTKTYKRIEMSDSNTYDIILNKNNNGLYDVISTIPQ